MSTSKPYPGRKVHVARDKDSFAHANDLQVRTYCGKWMWTCDDPRDPTKAEPINRYDPRDVCKTCQRLSDAHSKAELERRWADYGQKMAQRRESAGPRLSEANTDDLVVELGRRLSETRERTV